VETFLQSGGTKSSWWKRSSNLEEQNHRSGNLPPSWRNKIIAIWDKISVVARQKSLSTAEARVCFIYW
jgi:hypothetical protein